jgi:phage antirepressor YoqD-like protein
VGRAAPDAPAAPAQGQAPGAQAGSQDSAVLAPNSWSAQAKAEWAALSPTIRAEIARRETEVHRTLTRQDEERQLGNQINEVVRQNQDFFQRAGVTPQRLFTDYLNISKVLGGNDINAKAQLLRQAALQNGIDLRALAAMGQPRNVSANTQPGAQPPPQGSQPIPFHLLPPEMQQLYRDNQERTAREQREAQERTQREEQQTYEQIVAFRSQPKARFFDAVRDQMVALLNGGAAPTLEEAYEQACWMRPDIRDILLKEQTEAKNAEEARRAATINARRKGISVRGGAGSHVETAPPDRSLREELKANFAEAQRQRV